MITRRMIARVSVHPAKIRTKFVLVVTAIHNSTADSISQPMVIQWASSFRGMAMVRKPIAIATCSRLMTLVALVASAVRYLNKLASKRYAAAIPRAYQVSVFFSLSYITRKQRKTTAALKNGSNVRVIDGPLYKREFSCGVTRGIAAKIAPNKIVKSTVSPRCEIE